MEKNQILEQLQWRYAVKKFDASAKIHPQDWSVLQESLRLAPSSYGLQLWRFLHVKSPEILQQLKSATWNQSQVTDCSHYVVLATKIKVDATDVDKYLQRMSEVRGVELAKLEGLRKSILSDVVHGPRSEIATHWAQRQVYIAMGMLMQTAALLKIDSCPLEGLDPKAYDRILQLEGSGFGTVAAVALGYRSNDDKLATAKKVRFEMSEVFKVIE